MNEIQYTCNNSHIVAVSASLIRDCYSDGANLVYKNGK